MLNKKILGITIGAVVFILLSIVVGVLLYNFAGGSKTNVANPQSGVGSGGTPEADRPSTPSTGTPNINEERPATSGGRRSGRRQTQNTVPTEFKPLLGEDDVKDIESATVVLIISADQIDELIGGRTGKIRLAAIKHFKSVAKKAGETIRKDSSIDSKVRDAVKQLIDRPCLNKTVDLGSSLAWKDQLPCDGIFVLNSLKDMLSSSSVPKSKDALEILEKNFKEEESLEQPQDFADLCKQLVQVHKQLDDCFKSPSIKLNAKQHRQLEKLLRLFSFLQKCEYLSKNEDELDDIDVNSFFAAKIMSSSPIFSNTIKLATDPNKKNLPPMTKSLLALFGKNGEKIYILNHGAARQLYHSLQSLLDESTRKTLLMGLGPEKLILEVMEDFSNDPKTYTKYLCDLKLDILYERIIPGLSCSGQSFHRPKDQPDTITATGLDNPPPEFITLDFDRSIPMDNLPLARPPNPITGTLDDKYAFKRTMKEVQKRVESMLQEYPDQKLDEYVYSVVAVTYNESDEVEVDSGDSVKTSGAYSLIKSVLGLISHNLLKDLLADPDEIPDGKTLPIASVDPNTMRHIAMMHGKLLQVASRIPFSWNGDYLNLIFASDVKTLKDLSQQIIADKYLDGLSLRHLKYDLTTVKGQILQLNYKTLTESREFAHPTEINAESDAHWKYIRQEILMEASYRLALGALIYRDYFLAFVKPNFRHKFTKEFYESNCGPLPLIADQIADRCLKFPEDPMDVCFQPLIPENKGDPPTLTLQKVLQDTIGQLKNEQLSDFLLFSTGSRELPVSGYNIPIIRVTCDETKPDSVPTASTCSTSISIYPCASVEEFKRRFEIGLTHCHEYGKA